jgi:hypothetical protein
MLVVVPCGKRKIWDINPDAGPTAARDAYQGTPFKVNKEYGEACAARWVILSAKYGFIDPHFVIPENYNVTFADPSTNPIDLAVLVEQVHSMHLAEFDRVVALGSAAYGEKVRVAFAGTGARIDTPTAGLSLFSAISTVKRLVADLQS